MVYLKTGEVTGSENFFALSKTFFCAKRLAVRVRWQFLDTPRLSHCEHRRIMVR